MKKLLFISILSILYGQAHTMMRLSSAMPALGLFMRGPCLMTSPSIMPVCNRQYSTGKSHDRLGVDDYKRLFEGNLPISSVPEFQERWEKTINRSLKENIIGRYRMLKALFSIIINKRPLNVRYSFKNGYSLHTFFDSSSYKVFFTKDPKAEKGFKFAYNKCDNSSGNQGYRNVRMKKGPNGEVRFEFDDDQTKDQTNNNESQHRYNSSGNQRYRNFRMKKGPNGEVRFEFDDDQTNDQTNDTKYEQGANYRKEQSFDDNDLYFKTLGLSKGATQEEIRKKYLELVKSAHPDAGGCNKKFIEVQEAYEKLKNKT